VYFGENRTKCLAVYEEMYKCNELLFFIGIWIKMHTVNHVVGIYGTVLFIQRINIKKTRVITGAILLYLLFKIKYGMVFLCLYNDRILQ
jgi:hypothetical protein